MKARACIECAISQQVCTDVGECWTFGFNQTEQLGREDGYQYEHDNEDMDPRPSRIMTLPGHKVLKVAAGNWNTFVVTRDVKGFSIVPRVFMFGLQFDASSLPPETRREEENLGRNPNNLPVIVELPTRLPMEAPSW